MVSTESRSIGRVCCNAISPGVDGDPRHDPLPQAGGRLRHRHRLVASEYGSDPLGLNFIDSDLPVLGFVTKTAKVATAEDAPSVQSGSRNDTLRNNAAPFAVVVSWSRVRHVEWLMRLFPDRFQRALQALGAPLQPAPFLRCHAGLQNRDHAVAADDARQRECDA